MEYTHPFSKISNGLINEIMKSFTTKEGITIFFLVLSMFILVLWLSNVIKTNGFLLTLLSFIITSLLCWITWVHCS